MKKYATRVLSVFIAVLLAVPAACCAEDVFPWGKSYEELQHDAQALFAEQSDEWLIMTYTLTKIEMERRGVQATEIESPTKETTVPPGEYKVGKDIPAGEYTVKSAGAFFALMYIYSTEGHLIGAYNVTPQADIGKLSLEEGQTVQFTGDTLTFAPYKGLGF